MDLFDRITNINLVDYEKEIKNTIEEVRKTYSSLDTDNRTCMFYSSFIYENLKKKHIVSRIISTKDIGIDYEHRFVLVKDKDNYYLIDLTYNQFFDTIPEEFIELNNNGYMKVNKDILKDYIISFTGYYIVDDITEKFFR